MTWRAAAPCEEPSGALKPSAKRDASGSQQPISRSERPVKRPCSHRCRRPRGARWNMSLNARPQQASEQGLDAGLKPIANSAHRLDPVSGGRAAFQPAPKSEHLDVDTAVENIFVRPRRVHQMHATQRALGRFQKGGEQRELALCQFDGRTLGVR